MKAVRWSKKLLWKYELNSNMKKQAIQANERETWWEATKGNIKYSIVIKGVGAGREYEERN